jgi:hypothetical protein
MMRAKMRVAAIGTHEGIVQEDLTFTAVSKNEAYPEDGSDENNTFAKFTPMAELKMTVNNPALIGKFTVGQEFYVDFTPVAPAT